MEENVHKLPRISPRRFSLYFSELWLIWDGSESWTKEPAVIIVWHYFFFSYWAFGLLYLSGHFFLGTLQTSVLATLCYRYAILSFLVELIALLALLAAKYYLHILTTGRDTHFSSIAAFWGMWVMLFAGLYQNLYNAFPYLFSYAHPVYVPTATSRGLTILESFHAFLDFIIYSACTATSTSASGIAASSLAISAFNVIEVLGTVLIASLLVATFVGRSASSKSLTR
jgi:hypothetical protein